MGLSRGLALDTDVISSYEVQGVRIHNVVSCRVRSVLASRSTTLFAADIPLRHRFGFDVVIHRVAAIAGAASRTIEIARTITRNPPVSACFDVIRKPLLLSNIPLGRQREVIVAPLGEISLLVATPVNEGDIIQ